ncbi:MAG: glycosyltransferase family 39 protein [Cyanothece sp. SIO2G6]|nr:glycosyltransferase family 39 protein [Cyanothece sp. SIO2G6]
MNIPGTATDQKWEAIVDRWSEAVIYGGLAIASLFLFTVNLGDVPLRDWDESLVAQVAKEIYQAALADNVWLHPTFHGQPYFNKPPLVHWLVAIAYAIGGVNEWTARLPGALATACSVPLLYGLCRELFSQQAIAIFTACTYLTLLPVVRHGRLAMLDGMVLLGFLGLLLCVVRSRRNLDWSLGAGLSISVLWLTKGVIALPLMAIATGFILWDIPRLLRSGRWWLGLVLGWIPTILWYAAQGFHYGMTFWDIHLLDQMLSRAVDVVEQHRGPPWYYLVELLKYGWPWLLFLPMGVVAVWRDRSRSWAKLAIAWSGYLVLISVMSTKLPWYIMPLYPLVALVVGVELHRLWHTLSGASAVLTPSLAYRRILMGWLGIMAIAGWGGSLYYALFLADYGAGDGVLVWSLAVVGLTMMIAGMLLGRRDRQFISLLLWGFYLSLVLFVASPHWNWELGENYPVKPVAAMIQSAQSLPENPVFYTSHPLRRPSLDFYSGYPIIPTDRDRIQRQWRRDTSAVLLVTEADIAEMELKRVQYLGQEDGWVLIRRKPRRSQ